MKYISIILILFLSSCNIYERQKITPIREVDTVHKINNRLYLGTIIPDTILRQLRDYKVENHLLRVEIDDLKAKLERVRKLQKIDSILSKNDDI